jgi:two-component system chemotaxis response regulator CheB
MSFSDLVPFGATTVVVVEDGETSRAELAGMVDAVGGFRVIADCRSGYEAIRATHENNPDLVVLGMGAMDVRAIELLAFISSESPRPVVVLVGHPQTVSDPALATVDIGNIEFVIRPARDSNGAVLQQRLSAALEAAANASIGGLRIGRARRAAARATRAARRAARAGGDVAGAPARCAVAIAASTGGPRALIDVLPSLPADLQAAVVIVQHMPAGFTAYLADRLDRSCELHVKEARAGELLKTGAVYLAPGGLHMALQRTAAGISVTLEDGDPVWGLRPAADILFASVARHFGPDTVGVVLTGMGKDGAAGLRAIRDVGGWTAVQDPSLAVVASMPRTARPFAAAELPLDGLARSIVEQVEARVRKAS